MFFEDAAWLFASNYMNRGILRQDFNEASLLWRSVKASRGPILEIGRRHGGSTVLLLMAGDPREVVSIDIAPAHHLACEEYFHRPEIAARLDAVVADSGIPTGRSFGFAFIDGDHSYEGVRRDVIAHWPALKAFDDVAPTVVFHDAVPNGQGRPSTENYHEGVRLICEELCRCGAAEMLEIAGSSMLLRKCDELPKVFSSSINDVPTFVTRADLTRLVVPGAVAIELGVARGNFSATLLEHSELSFLYSVDMYAGDRGHDVDQYKVALERLDRHRTRNSVLRMRFDEALSLFKDEMFDFVYIDGYAHTGQESGQTLRGWYPKTKSGGVFAGDDYSPRFPMVVQAVDDFVAKHGLTLHVASFEPSDDPYSQYPSWFIYKP